MTGCLYYSDNRPDPAILAASRWTIARSGLFIVAVTLQPIDWPAAQVQIVWPGTRGYLTMFQQILAGLEALPTETVCFCEHDVLYHPSHFTFTPPRRDVVYYNEHVWKVDWVTGRAIHHRVSQTSGLCADRQLLLDHYRRRVAIVKRDGHRRRHGFEPGTRRVRHGGIDDLPSATWWSEGPNVDLRHDANLTGTRWSPAQFRSPRYTVGWTESDTVPGWGQTLGRMPVWLHEVTTDGE